MNESKVKIELTSYDVLEIMTFVNQFPEILSHPNCVSLKRAVDNLGEQVFRNISMEQIEDAENERLVNQLLGISPKPQ